MAQMARNQQEMDAASQEMMLILREMSKKQFIPMIIRTVIWFGIWGILQLLFRKYDEIVPFDVLFFGRGVFALYFLVSMSFSIVLMFGRMLNKKMNPNASGQKEEYIHDHLQVLSTKIALEGEQESSFDQSSYDPKNSEQNFSSSDYSAAYSSAMDKSDAVNQINKADSRNWKKRL